jgi:outer membrane lipoprotein-sorting protein
MKRKLGQRSWFFMLPLFLFLAGSAAAAQFSALMMIKDGDRVMPGRIYVQDGKMRQEFTDAEGQTVTIVRPDQKVIWFIMPLERAYVEMPLKKKLPGQFIQIPKEALAKRLVGKETVNGYETEKYEVTIRGGAGLERQTLWVAPKLGTPVKLIVKERNFSMEYKSIKEGPQADRLFNLPPGYKKLVSPDLLPSWKGY